MESTIIVIAACHRTGSGLVSSMLSSLGVAMGQPDPQTARSPDELWEDQDFVRLHRGFFREIENGVYRASRWRYPAPILTAMLAADWRALAAHRAKQPLWGFKDPRFVFLMDFGLGVLSGLGLDVRLVWLSRNNQDVAKSLQRRDGGEFQDALNIAAHQRNCWEVAKSRLPDWPAVELRYEDLVTDPLAATRVLAGVLPYTAAVSEAKIAATAGLVRVRSV